MRAHISTVHHVNDRVKKGIYEQPTITQNTYQTMINAMHD